MLDPYDPNCMIHEEYQEPEAVDYRRNLSPPASHHHHHHNEDRRRSDSYRQSTGPVGPRRNGRSRSPSERHSNGGHYNGNQGRFRGSSPPSSRRYDSSDQSRYNSNGGGSSYRSSYKSSNGSQGGRRSRSRSPVHRPADPVYLAGQLQQLQQLQQQIQPPTPEINFKWDRTVFVSNLPLDIRWFDLKDLFRRKVGDIVFSEVFEKDQKSLGFGAVTFRTTRDADRAVDVMHQYDLAGHKMIVKLDRDGSRTRRALDEAYSVRKPSESGLAVPGGGLDSISSLAQQLLAANSLLVNPLIAAAVAASNLPSAQPGPPPLMPPSLSGINSSNVSPQLLNQIAAQAKVDGPVSTRLHVSGLSYRVDESRLRELFSTAGNLLSVIILRDRDNNSRGMANIEYETPLEALTALLTLNKSVLEDRVMNIIFDTRHTSRSDSQSVIKSPQVPIGGPIRPSNKYNGSAQTPVPSIIGIQSNSNLLNSLLTPTGSATVTPDLAAGLAAALGLNPAATLGLLGNLTMPGGNLLNNMSPLNPSSNPPVNRVSKILVKNVPFSWDDFKIKEIFQKAGKIESVDARTKGTAYIRYSSGDEARKAIDQLNGARFEGRTLEITFDYH